MTTYQDVLQANGVVLSWALTEASGLTFAPWIGGTNLTGTGVFAYRQTGPFANSFGLQFPVGGTLRFPFTAALFPPVTTEVWVKLTSATPSANTIIFYEGDNTINGSGVYVATNGHIHILRGGSGDTDSGVLWPSTAWHLIQLASPDTTHASLFIDGFLQFSATFAAPLSPSPNGQGWMCDDASFTCPAADLISYPALYLKALSGNTAYATFLASTDPTSALNYILAASGVSGLLPDLSAILAAVQKTFPTT